MYALYKIPFLDHRTRCYKNIIKISSMPKGPLKKRIRRVNLPKLSPFKNNCCDFQNDTCILAIKNKDGELMTVDELPHLFEFLVLNNYTINTQITEMMNQSQVKLTDPLICFISYP